MLYNLGFLKKFVLIFEKMASVRQRVKSRSTNRNIFLLKLLLYVINADTRVHCSLQFEKSKRRVYRSACRNLLHPNAANNNNTLHSESYVKYKMVRTVIYRKIIIRNNLSVRCRAPAPRAAVENQCTRVSFLLDSEFASTTIVVINTNK